MDTQVHPSGKGVSVAKLKRPAPNQESLWVLAIFFGRNECMICVITHQATRTRISRRRLTLVPASSLQSLARCSHFAQLPALPVCARALSRLCERRTASQLRPIRSRKRPPFHALHSRGTGARGAPFSDNGRALQELPQEAAPSYINALKRQRTKAQKRRLSLALWPEPPSHKSALPIAS